MTFEIPRIYPITNTRVSSLSHVEQAIRLIAGGARIIQIRDKTATALDFFNSASAVVQLARKHGVKIIINDRIDIALAVRADGVHLGQDDMPPDLAREILGPAAIIGFSTHSLEQARSAIGLPIDYLAIGPIFKTATKQDPDPPTGLEVLTQLRPLLRGMPVAAIGGINDGNIAAVFSSGADSAAIIGWLLAERTGIETRMRHLGTLV